MDLLFKEVVLLNIHDQFLIVLLLLPQITGTTLG